MPGNSRHRRAAAFMHQPAGQVIATYTDYADAQRAVDLLSDKAFPVQAVTIVGTDLRLVERVTGRLTYPRVAVGGAASGAWFGLMVGLLLSLFAKDAPMMETVLSAVGLGAAFGMLFGVLSYALTGGRRDFTSVSQVVAGGYQILCGDDVAGKARQLLAESGLSGNVPTAATHLGAPSSPAGPGAAGQSHTHDGVVDPAATPPVTGRTYGEMIDAQRNQTERRD